MSRPSADFKGFKSQETYIEFKLNAALNNQLFNTNFNFVRIIDVIDRLLTLANDKEKREADGYWKYLFFFSSHGNLNRRT